MSRIRSRPARNGRCAVVDPTGEICSPTLRRRRRRCATRPGSGTRTDDGERVQTGAARVRCWSSSSRRPSSKATRSAPTSSCPSASSAGELLRVRAASRRASLLSPELGHERPLAYHTDEADLHRAPAGGSRAVVNEEVRRRRFESGGTWTSELIGSRSIHVACPLTDSGASLTARRRRHSRAEAERGQRHAHVRRSRSPR